MEHKRLEELQGSEYDFSDLSQDIEWAVENSNKKMVSDIFGGPEDVTGAITKAGEAELLEVWLTDSTRPFDVTARYYRVL